jgi:VWFA-related protein
LAASDFAVFEDGRRQEISVFTEVNVPPPEPPSAGWIREVDSDVRTNALGKDQRLFLIAMDDAAFSGDLWALRKMKEIAQGFVDRLPASDLVAVVYSQNNAASQDFTNDRQKLRTAIEAMLSDPGIPSMQAALYSVGVLNRAVEFLTEAPDRRKAIVYVGTGLAYSAAAAAVPIKGGFLGDPWARARSLAMRDLRDRITELLHNARLGNINIYTIDACGLRGGNACVANQDVMDYLIGLATATGARPVVNSNDFGPGLDAIIEENSNYYLVGFQSDNSKRDGTLRRLDVKVNGDDLTVRTRSGYYAPRAEKSANLGRSTNTMSDSVAGMLPSSRVPLRATAIPVALPGSQGAAVAIVIGLSQVLPERASRMIENVNLVVSAYNTDGKQFGTTKDRFAVRLRPGQSAEVEYELLARLDLPPGRYQLRIGAEIESERTAGSVYYDVVVPDFQKARLSASAAIFTKFPTSPGAQGFDWKELLPQLPTSDRSFSVPERIFGALRLFQFGISTPALVQGRIIIRNADDDIVVDRPFEIASETFVRNVADHIFEIPVAQLAAGRYLLTIEAGAGPERIRRDAPFEIGKD